MTPALVRHVLLPLHERLKRKPTFSWLRRLEDTQWLSPEQLREYQFRRLRDLLEFARVNVPYYRDLMRGCGFTPGDMVGPEDVRQLPCLTRDDLRTRFEDLRARSKFPGVHRRSSGGSTGSPVTVEVEMGRMGMQEAARLRAHSWFGLRPGDREVVVWGSPIEITKQDRLRQLRDWLLNSVLLSAFDLDEPSLERYARTILRSRPAKIYGYASALHLLARHFAARGFPRPEGLKAVFATAEPLYDFQRQVIGAALGCPVAVEYGCRDGGLVALECPAGGLHIAAEGMYVEVLGADEDGYGEIVLTNLDSFAFPIVRYRTGDIGRLDPSECTCGRGLPKLASVEGRRTDFLVTPSGRVLHALSAIYLLRELPFLRQFRVVQEDVGHVTVQVVPARALTAHERGGIQTGFLRLLGNGARVSVNELQEIPRSGSGKFRYVESRVSPDVIEALTGGRGAASGGTPREEVAP